MQHPGVQGQPSGSIEHDRSAKPRSGESRSSTRDQATEKTYSYFAHEADMGIVGQGPTLESAFEAAAAATFALTVRLATVRPTTVVRFTFEEADPELALVTWLNRLLVEARVAGLIFGAFQLRRDGDRWEGEGWGEPWRDDLERGVEVKGATLTMLSVKPSDSGWEARCVVDV